MKGREPARRPRGITRAALWATIATLALAGCARDGGGLGALSAGELEAPEAAPVEAPAATGGSGGRGGASGGSEALALDFVVPIFPGLDTYSSSCDPFDDDTFRCL